jgi:hypothetical protein
MENVKKNVQLLLKDDRIQDKDLKAKIQLLDDKVQQMLLWSTICSVWSYLVLIMVIIRIYGSFNGKHPVLLMSTMISMYVLMGLLIFFAWKGITCKRSHFSVASKTYILYQINKLSGQRKLISFHLLEYALLLGVASIFFFLDVKNGLSFLLKLTAPVSMITYVLGIYFIINFTRQMKKLELINRQINYLFMKDISKN